MDDDYSVLLVDDEQNILSSLKRLLMEEDFRLLTASGGEEALAMLAGGERPAVIVTDQRMPGMEGAEFLARARELVPEAEKIMLTGYADIGAAVDAVNRGGISRYVTKPWNDDDLKQIIREALKRYTLVRENQKLTAELQNKNRILADFNEYLEQKVQERTGELLRKIKELEGRDKIQQHLLTVHPLEETLQVVLQVIIEVVGVDMAVLHLLEADNSLRTAALAGAPVEESDREKGVNQPLSPGVQEAVRLALQNKEPILSRERKAADGKICQLAVVPIFKGDRPMLVIEVQKEGDLPIAELQTISSFGMQAAVAISDARMKACLPSLEVELDDLLRNLKDDGVA